MSNETIDLWDDSYDDELDEQERYNEEWDDEDCDDMILDDASDPADELIAADPEAYEMFAEDFNGEQGS